MGWFRRMRFKEYRKLFWKDFRKRLKLKRTGKILFRIIVASLFELLFAYLTLHLFFIDHNILLSIFGIGVCVTLGFVIRSYWRTLSQPFREADKFAHSEILRRHGR